MNLFSHAERVYCRTWIESGSDSGDAHSSHEDASEFSNFTLDESKESVQRKPGESDKWLYIQMELCNR